MRYVESPSDEQVNELFNEATVFVQTSTHEGFALPPLEAMATGGAVVCTDAHGNRDFCVDGENCLMPAPDRGCGQRRARTGCSPTQDLRERLGRAGEQTAEDVRLGAADRRPPGVLRRSRASNARGSRHRGRARARIGWLAEVARVPLGALS